MPEEVIPTKMPEQVIPGMIRPMTLARLGELIRPGMPLSELTSLFGPPLTRFPHSSGGEHLTYSFPPLQSIDGIGGFVVWTKADIISRWEPSLVGQ